jgi:hypothetical protein
MYAYRGNMHEQYLTIARLLLVSRIVSSGDALLSVAGGKQQSSKTLHLFARARNSWPGFCEQ